MHNLTLKQMRFVDQYLVDGNGAAAAERAGYGKVGARAAAHRLLTTNHDVQAAIAARQTLDSQALQIVRQDAIKGLLEAVEQARVLGDPGAMIAGWSAIGKMLGFYAPGICRIAALLKDDGGKSRRFEAMSDAELAAAIRAGSSTAHVQATPGEPR